MLEMISENIMDRHDITDLINKRDYMQLRELQRRMQKRRGVHIKKVTPYDRKERASMGEDTSVSGLVMPSGQSHIQSSLSVNVPSNHHSVTETSNGNTLQNANNTHTGVTAQIPFSPYRTNAHTAVHKETARNGLKGNRTSSDVNKTKRLHSSPDQSHIQSSKFPSDHSVTESSNGYSLQKANSNQTGVTAQKETARNGLQDDQTSNDVNKTKRLQMITDQSRIQSSKFSSDHHSVTEQCSSQNAKCIQTRSTTNVTDPISGTGIPKRTKTSTANNTSKRSQSVPQTTLEQTVQSTSGADKENENDFVSYVTKDTVLTVDSEIDSDSRRQMPNVSDQDKEQSTTNLYEKCDTYKLNNVFLPRKKAMVISQSAHMENCLFYSLAEWIHTNDFDVTGEMRIKDLASTYRLIYRRRSETIAKKRVKIEHTNKRDEMTIKNLLNNLIVLYGDDLFQAFPNYLPAIYSNADEMKKRAQEAAEFNFDPKYDLRGGMEHIILISLLCNAPIIVWQYHDKQFFSIHSDMSFVLKTDLSDWPNLQGAVQHRQIKNPDNVVLHLFFNVMDGYERCSHYETLVAFDSRY